MCVTNPQWKWHREDTGWKACGEPTIDIYVIDDFIHNILNDKDVDKEDSSDEEPIISQYYIVEDTGKTKKFVATDE